MKFRFVDRIFAGGADAIQTEKAISFEEFSLLKPWGRKGAFPESLLLQVAVESAAHLVTRRSGGARTAVLEEAEGVRFEWETKPGEVLRCRVEALVSSRYAFEISTEQGRLASGTLFLRELPLEACFDPEAHHLLQEALHVAARS